jgi:hypothetical protein
MTQEERTREEILKCMVANTQALTALVAELLRDRRQASGAPVAEAPVAEAPVAEAPVAEAPVAEVPAEEAPVAEAPAEEAPAPAPRPRGRPRRATPEPDPVDIPVRKTPVKPSKGLADLREALQACLAARGMEETKARLAPYTKLPDVPDEEIEAVIARLSA